MKALVYFQSKKENNIFEGARLRKSIKGALEMVDVEHTSNLLDTYNIIHLISPTDEKIVDEAKEYHCPVVASALYAEDDPEASYIDEVINDRGKTSVLKPRALKFLNKVDMVLVPSEANVEFLQKSGVTTPIKVLKPGINMSRFDFSRDDEKDIFFRYFREDRNKKLVFAVGEYDRNMTGINSFINAAKKCPNHTDAVKEHLVPVELSYEQKSYIYANEADLLNVALFGKTAKEWREVNPDKEGNLRDYANTIELAILSNLEFMNAQLIANKISPKERLIILNKEANKEKELFNKNNEKPIKRIEKK